MSTPFNMKFPLFCFLMLLQLRFAFSLPSLPSNNPPSLSLIQNPAASNLSKPTCLPTPLPHLPPPTHRKLHPLADIPPYSSDTFRIPDTDLVLNFESFGPILDIFDLRTLLTQAQDDIQTDVTRRGADATAPSHIYAPWLTRGIALQLHVMTRAATLGQLGGLLEGLQLYLVKQGRARATRFRVLEQTSDWSVVLVVGEIWAT